MKTFEVTGRLLEFNEGTYQGSPYASAKIRSEEIAEGTILKYKIDVKKVPSLQELLDQEITVDVAIERGMNDTAALRIVHLHLDGFPKED